MRKTKKMDDNHFGQSDRDLLIQVKTLLDVAIKDIKELKDNTAIKIADLYNRKLDIAEADRLLKDAEKAHLSLAKRDEDFEKRLRRLEYFLAIATGAFILIELYLRYGNVLMQ